MTTPTLQIYDTIKKAAQQTNQHINRKTQRTAYHTALTINNQNIYLPRTTQATNQTTNNIYQQAEQIIGTQALENQGIHTNNTTNPPTPPTHHINKNTLQKYTATATPENSYWDITINELNLHTTTTSLEHLEETIQDLIVLATNHEFNIVTINYQTPEEVNAYKTLEKAARILPALKYDAVQQLVQQNVKTSDIAKLLGTNLTDVNRVMRQEPPVRK